MNATLRRPLPKHLALPPEQHAKRTPQKDETHVRHDGRQIPARHDPRRDELAEAVAPHVLVDGDGDEDAARDGLVAVDGVGRGDGGQRGDLDAGAGEADDDDGLDGVRSQCFYICIYDGEVLRVGA